MKVSLVIMAAGLGSRYGGDKQVDGIGPHGEILMEYSIYDALRAGFNKIVFIIKPEMEAKMRELCGNYLEKRIAKDGSPVEVAYAYQDFSSVPDFYHIPPGADKALRHRPRPAVRLGQDPGALLRHQRRRLLRHQRLRDHLSGTGLHAGGGQGRHGGLSFEEYRQPPRHRVQRRLPGGGGTAPFRP